jgi:hypothetical protein
MWCAQAVQAGTAQLVGPSRRRHRKRPFQLLWSAERTRHNRLRRNGLDPQRYLTSVLAKIGQTPAAEVDQFLPDVWKRDSLSAPDAMSS